MGKDDVVNNEATPQLHDLPWGQTWPSLEQFRYFANSHRVIPVVRQLLADELTAVGIYRCLAQGRPGTFILESAEFDGSWNHWSFVGVNAQATLLSDSQGTRLVGEVPVGLKTSGTALEILEDCLNKLHTPTIAGLPPLTGALVGAVGWETVKEWEPNLKITKSAEYDLPSVFFSLASDVVAVNHQDGTIWLIANAINTDGGACGVDQAYERCCERLGIMQAQLARPLSVDLRGCSSDYVSAPVNARVTQQEFEDSVRAGINHIYEGDIFQVVLSQRLDVECPAEALEVYRVLRHINPSPYMYYLQQEDFAVVGSSPETLFRLQDRQITTFPIAGSRPRGDSPVADQLLAQEMLEDPKERSEHIMLVDLSRNDLSKVCQPGSVEVVSLMEVKRFSHIQHISSTVVGALESDYSAVDCLRATFPAGTLSGAPKPKAIELIDRFEPAGRGLYGGVVGYFDFNGNADLAIAIRTAVICDGKAHVQAGAGVVAQSDSNLEYIEATNKAAAAIKAAQRAAQTVSLK